MTGWYSFVMGWSSLGWSSKISLTKSIIDCEIMLGVKILLDTNCGTY